jgi:hypothetical protein
MDLVLHSFGAEEAADGFCSGTDLLDDSTGQGKDHGHGDERHDEDKGNSRL